MFFKKKKATTEAEALRNQRAQYRKRNTKAQPLEASLRVPGWDPLRVELLDLSVSGAGVRVPFAQDRNLRVGDTVEIAIGSVMRDEIVTPARVANVSPDGPSHLRYGFAFLNVGNLYSQLDSFYARHFNRRRAPRVIPALDRRIQVVLRARGEELRVPLHDLSESGVGLTLSRDSAATIADQQQLELTFRLPGSSTELTGSATIRHRTPMNHSVLIGVEFDFEASNGFQLHRAELREFVEQRAKEIEKWEKGLR